MAREQTPPGISNAIRHLQEAVTSEECWACGCLHGALSAIEEACLSAEQAPELESAVHAARKVLTDPKYDCRGCEVCHAAVVMNALGIEERACAREAEPPRQGWPPLAGSYRVLRYRAPVAVCTLTDEALVERIVAEVGPEVAIVGTLQTENLGVERIILNFLANPNIRFLIVCGADSRRAVGHLPGQSLLALASAGIDARSRIVGAEGKRPVLRNVSPEAVEHFRRTVEVIDLIGVREVHAIAAAARECAERNPGPGEPFSAGPRVPTIKGWVTGPMTSDPAGYFVIFVDWKCHLLVLEHYAKEGVLDAVIEGRSAAELYLPAVEKTLVSRLDHAAYLGRELARAECSLESGEPYVQDAAPEAPRESYGGGSCGCRGPC